MDSEHARWLHSVSSTLADKLIVAVKERGNGCSKPELTEHDYYRDVVVDVLNDYARFNGMSFAEMDRYLSPQPRIGERVTERRLEDGERRR